MRMSIASDTSGHPDVDSLVNIGCCAATPVWMVSKYPRGYQMASPQKKKSPGSVMVAPAQLHSSVSQTLQGTLLSCRTGF